AVQDRLAEGGVERGVELLRRGDAAAALPWLSLALSRSDPEPWRQTLYLLARAAVDGDRARAERLADHLARPEPPSELSTAVAEIVAVIAASRSARRSPAPPGPLASRGPSRRRTDVRRTGPCFTSNGR